MTTVALVRPNLKNTGFRRFVVWITIVLHLCFSAQMLSSTTAVAQVFDTEPPVIGFDAINQAYKGDTQVFTISVTDNESLESVLMFYRFSDNEAYQRVPMSRIGNTVLYTYTIEPEAIAQGVDSVQYYIEAKDQFGNRTLRGFSFDPLERQLIDTNPVAVDQSDIEVAVPVVAPEQSQSGWESLSTVQKVAVGALGLLAVGVLAGVSGGGSSSDENVGSPAMLPVNIVMEPLSAQ